MKRNTPRLISDDQYIESVVTLTKELKEIKEVAHKYRVRFAQVSEELENIHRYYSMVIESFRDLIQAEIEEQIGYLTADELPIKIPYEAIFGQARRLHDM